MTGKNNVMVDAVSSFRDYNANGFFIGQRLQHTLKIRKVIVNIVSMQLVPGAIA